MKRDNKTSET